mmetsp:Transcript_35861/g.101506  ORF Transcript_35861/g.101506 Transcript_35861/m.101506 type:complete len:250 (+) Transcript_35861:543-1292(+)
MARAVQLWACRSWRRAAVCSALAEEPPGWGELASDSEPTALGDSKVLSSEMSWMTQVGGTTILLAGPSRHTSIGGCSCCSLSGGTLRGPGRPLMSPESRLEMVVSEPAQLLLWRPRSVSSRVPVPHIAFCSPTSPASTWWLPFLLMGEEGLRCSESFKDMLSRLCSSTLSDEPSFSVMDGRAAPFLEAGARPLRLGGLVVPKGARPPSMDALPGTAALGSSRQLWLPIFFFFFLPALGLGVFRTVWCRS